jgi:hypothetical protein
MSDQNLAAIDSFCYYLRRYWSIGEHDARLSYLITEEAEYSGSTWLVRSKQAHFLAAPIPFTADGIALNTIKPQCMSSADP